MKTRSSTLLAAWALAAVTLLPAIASAQDDILSYQGRVQSSGTNFTGTGQFKFALVTATNVAETATATATINFGAVTAISVTAGGSGYSSAPAVFISGGGGSGATATATVSGGSVVSFTVTSIGSGYTSPPTVAVAAPPPDLDHTTYWSNDGTSTAGGEPSASVPVPVNKGLFTVRLGDSNLVNMQKFPAGLFVHRNLELRAWFNDGVHGFSLINSQQRLTAVAYAFTANYATVAEGITGTVPANQIGGSIAGSQLAADAVTSGKIADGTITAGDLGPVVLNQTFWRLDGNAGTTGNVNFLGTTDDKPLDLRVNNLRGLRLQPNSTNSIHIIGGWVGNHVAGDRIGVTISGGGDAYNTNQVGADFGTIGGGGNNAVKNDATGSTIGGGQDNTVVTSSPFSTIGGGYANTVDGNLSTIGGGGGNSTSAGGATIAGGTNNAVRGRRSFIGGGIGNQIGTDSSAATIAGGQDNTIHTNAPCSVIPGGCLNAVGINANHAFAAGHQAYALHEGAFVWADAIGTNLYSFAENSVTMRATGGYRLYTSTTNSGVYLSPWASAWSTISDRAAKKNIRPLDSRDVLEKLAQLPVPQWNYKSEADDSVPHIGPMAQDFKAAFYPGRDEKGISTLEFDGVALAAIQGLNQKLTDELKRRDAENAELRAAVADLRRLVERLQPESAQSAR